MTQGKAACFLFIGLYFKRKIGRQHEIAAETDDVADSVGYRLVHVVYQQQVDGVLDGDGDTADDAKSDELYDFLPFNHLLLNQNTMMDLNPMYFRYPDLTALQNTSYFSFVGIKWPV